MDSTDTRKLFKAQRCPSLERLSEIQQAFAEEWEGPLEALRTISENLDSVDVGPCVEISEALATLGQHQVAQDLEECASGIGFAIEHCQQYLDLPDNYDNVITALENAQGLKESDSYPGKGDDVQEAWEEVHSYVDLFCESVDALPEEEEVPEEEEEEVPTNVSDSITIYAQGLISLSVCAPATLSVGEVEAEVNIQNPTGTDSPWRVSEDPTFRTGESNPCVCECDHDRLHYLLSC